MYRNTFKISSQKLVILPDWIISRCDNVTLTISALHLLLLTGGLCSTHHLSVVILQLLCWHVMAGRAGRYSVTIFYKNVSLNYSKTWLSYQLLVRRQFLSINTSYIIVYTPVFSSYLSLKPRKCGSNVTKISWAAVYYPKLNLYEVIFDPGLFAFVAWLLFV